MHCQATSTALSQKFFKCNQRVAYQWMLQSLNTSSFSNNTGNLRITYHGGAFLWPLLQWKRNTYYIFRVCVCSQSYIACNVHAPYCHLWPVRLCSIFSTLSHKRHDFRNKSLNIKCVFWFSLQFLSEKFLIPRRAEREIWSEIYIGLHQWRTEGGLGVFKHPPPPWYATASVLCMTSC
jgi:hypothetical protein